MTGRLNLFKLPRFCELCSLSHTWSIMTGKERINQMHLVYKQACTFVIFLGFCWLELLLGGGVERSKCNTFLCSNYTISLSTDFRCLCLNLTALYFMYWGLTFRNSTFCQQDTFFLLRTDSYYSIAEVNRAWVSTSILSCLYGVMPGWLQTTFGFTWPFVSRLRRADQTPPGVMWQDVPNQHRLRKNLCSENTLLSNRCTNI